MVDRSIKHLYPPFATKIVAVLLDLDAWCKVHWVGHGCEVSEGFRTTQRQIALYHQGRTVAGDVVTWDDGITHKSSHQSGLAVDIVGLTISGAPTWDPPHTFWDALTSSAHAHGLQRIMDYSNRTDFPHVQWPLSDHQTYVDAAAWLRENRLI